MRGLPVRRTAFTALCASLVLGFAAPSALAADGGATRERAHAVPGASLSGADALLARARNLDDVEPALSPVTDLLDTSLRAGGRMDADRASRLGAAAEDALTRLAESAGPAGAPAADRVAPRTPSRSADVTDDALAAVDEQLDALLAAAASGDADQILPAATKLVTGLKELAGSLAQEELAELSELPGPAEAPTPPADTAVTLPALPVTPVTPSTLPAPVSPPAPKAPVPAT
ncbi:hypothetical protein ACF09K_06455 [Streptomyces sp. NPDC014882]|uniref:hypothetical protein n=1 Tax=Streptomyces sp. NPDC014882 TaxID=3364927 RepID=UPI003702FF31